MKPRVLVLPIAAVVILALVVYRIQREERRPEAGPPIERQLAPNIVLSNQSNQLVKLDAYLGRTRVVLVFFDGAQGADRDPLLVQLVEQHDALEAAGVQVIAVSTATRFVNRQAAVRMGSRFPFPLLTDIDLTGPLPAPAHQAWGLFDPVSNQTATGLFLIDRDGTVRFESGRPRPVSDAEAAVEVLIEGGWPDK